MRVASNPSTTGIFTSIRITSGRSSRASIDGLLAVLGDPDDVDPIVFAEHRHQRLGKEPVVVGDEDSDGPLNGRRREHGERLKPVVAPRVVQTSALSWPEVRGASCGKPSLVLHLVAFQTLQKGGLCWGFCYIQLYAICGNRMTSSTAALEAVLLDPHPIWLDAIELVLGRVGVDVIGKTSSGRDAPRLVEDRSPDLLTVEINALPGEPSGLDVLRQACATTPKLRAIVLSTYHDTANIDNALAAGASAYVVKTAHPDDVASAVRQAFEHSVFTPGSSPVPDAPPDEAQIRPERPGGLTTARARDSQARRRRPLERDPCPACSG